MMRAMAMNTGTRNFISTVTRSCVKSQLCSLLMYNSSMYKRKCCDISGMTHPLAFVGASLLVC